MEKIWKKDNKSLENKIRRVTKKQIDSKIDGIDEENVLYVKHGKKWVSEPAALVSDEYLDYRRGKNENRKMQLFIAKSVIDNGLKGLTKREKEIILLYVKGHTQKEVAAQLGITRGSVGQYLKRAKTKLKKLIPEFMENTNDVI